jgi:hypothetical protein
MRRGAYICTVYRSKMVVSSCRNQQALGPVCPQDAHCNGRVCGRSPTSPSGESRSLGRLTFPSGPHKPRRRPGIMKHAVSSPLQGRRGNSHYFPAPAAAGQTGAQLCSRLPREHFPPCLAGWEPHFQAYVCVGGPQRETEERPTYRGIHTAHI